jgi:hypothetical protein
MISYFGQGLGGATIVYSGNPTVSLRPIDTGVPVLRIDDHAANCPGAVFIASVGSARAEEYEIGV